MRRVQQARHRDRRARRAISRCDACRGLALAPGADRWTVMEGGCRSSSAANASCGIGVAGGSFEWDARVAREAVESIGAGAGE